MRIDAIAKRGGQPVQYELTFSDGSALRLYPQTLADFGLYVGMELEQEELERLRQAAGKASAKMRAVRIVAASAVSSRDLQQRLRRKGEQAPDAQAAVQWMEELGLVNDRETARQIVRRGVARGYGEHRLRQMLYEKQIPRSLWEEALSDLPEPDAAISRFLEEKLPPDADQRQTKRVLDALLRRGFAWQDIRRCLGERGRSIADAQEE